MPRYFFDVRAGARHMRDERGRDLFDRFLAVREAEGMLGTLEAVAELGSRSEEIVVQVRDEADTVVYEARGG